MSETRQSPPNDFRDPFWQNLIDQEASNWPNVPRELVSNIILRGERTPNDRIGRDGERGVVQILPRTRDGIIKQTGRDPWLTPENQIFGAFFLLDGSLRRNQGNIAASVSEYQGGTNRANWGPNNRAYTNRVMASFYNSGRETGETPAQRVRYEDIVAQFEARRETDDPMRRVYQAYRDGRMTPEDASAFEGEVRGGRIMLGRGEGLIGENVAQTEYRQPIAPASNAIVANEGPLNAYRQGRMTPEDRLEFERLVRNGTITVPQGFQLGQSARPGTPGRATPPPAQQGITEPPRGATPAAPQAAPAPPMQGAPARQAEPALPEAQLPTRGGLYAEDMMAGTVAPVVMPEPATAAPARPMTPQQRFGQRGAIYGAPAPEQEITPAPAGPRGTTVGGLAGAVTAPLALPAAGTVAGFAVGGPAGALGGFTVGTLTALAGDPIVRAVNATLGTQFTEPTKAMEALLARAGVEQPATEAERIVKSATEGAVSSGGLAALSRIMSLASSSPVVRAVMEKLAIGPRSQVAGGAGAGGSGQSAAEMGYGPGAQLALALAGGFAGASLGGTRVAAGPRIAKDVAEAERNRVRLATTDVMPPSTPIGRLFQRAAENVPFTGTAGMRVSQQGERVEATRQLLREYGATSAANVSDDVVASLRATREAQKNKYVAQKTEVIDRLAQSPAPVSSTNVTRKIDDILATKDMQLEINAPIRRELEMIKRDVGAISDLRTLENFRKGLGDRFSTPELGSVRTTGEQLVSSLYGPLRQDMADYIKANGWPRDITKWEVANRRLADMVGELNNTAFRRVLNEGAATPETIRSMLFSNKPSDVRRLYANLSPDGRARAQTAILEEAISKAGGIDNINPTQFVNQVQRLGASTGVFFTGPDKARLDGFVRVLNLTRRAQEAAANPATGVQAVPLVGAALVTDLMGGAGGGLAAVGGFGLVARMYESTIARNILSKIPSTRVGSNEERDLVVRLLNRATSVTQDQAKNAGNMQ